MPHAMPVDIVQRQLEADNGRDLEHTAGRGGGGSQALMVLAIYEVENGLIRRMHFVRMP